jgi:hypothetical protein
MAQRPHRVGLVHEEQPRVGQVERPAQGAGAEIVNVAGEG